MATYAIGDVQGCFEELCQLIEKLQFNPHKDELWFAGDLVNRGPASLEVLRFVHALGERAKVVLGNHDIHLLAVAHAVRALQFGDTFSDVLNAPDREVLLDWLCHRPLMHWDDTLGIAMVHAGIPPQWNLHQAQVLAQEVEFALRTEQTSIVLEKMYGNTPGRWRESQSDEERYRYIINALTRLRYCTPEGELDLQHSGAPGTQPPHFTPWFQTSQRKTAEIPIVFGHWASLKLNSENAQRLNAIHIDTGCVWGGKLTAVALPELHYTQVQSLQPKVY